MAKTNFNSTKLGIFVIAGISILVLLLYVIGKNQFLFGNTFLLKARFENLQGLMPGNNIRYSGIQAGTVKSIEVIDDTTMEVSLLVQTDMKKFIRQNAKVSIGTDGLMGNKLINIEPSGSKANHVEEGDILLGARGADTDEMIQVLNHTNNDVATVAAELKTTVQRLNNSNEFWNLLNDKSLPNNLRISLHNIRGATEKASRSMTSFNMILEGLENGKGSLGELLNDTTLTASARASFSNINHAAIRLDSTILLLNSFIQSIQHQVEEGEGAMHMLLKDKEMASRLKRTLVNIEKGTNSFNETMNAIKSSFLFRNYFKKLEQRRKGTMTLGLN